MASRGMVTVVLLTLLAACTSQRIEPRATAPVAPGSVPRPTPAVGKLDRPVPLPTPPGQAPAASAAYRVAAPRALAPLAPSQPIVPVRRAAPEPVLPALPTLAMPPEALPGLPSADDIRIVQETLAEAQLYRGPLDGRWSPELREGVLRHQRRHGLPETAALDAETLRSFDLDPSPNYGSAGAGPRPHAGIR